MSWDEAQASGSVITHAEWNTMVTDVKKHWYISGMEDITWDSAAWNNSSLVWDDTAQTWKPMMSGGSTDNFDHTLYITSANIITNFADSSNINSRFANSANIQSKFVLSDSYNASSNFYPSGKGASHAYLSGLTDVAVITSKTDADVLTWNAAQSKWSSQAAQGGISASDIKASTGTWTFVSSNKLWAGTGYISAQTGIYTHFISANNTNLSTAGETPSSWTWATPTATSGLSISNTGKVSGNLAIFIDDYIASTNALANFAGSSAIISKYLHSGVTLNSVSANRLWTDGYVSSQQGIYVHFVSANNSNITGTFDATQYMTSANIIANYPQSSLVNKTYLDSVSSNATSAYDWVNASSQRYEDLLTSGASYTKAYDWFVESAQKISAYQSSGEEYSSAYNWYTESANKLSGFVASGDEYSTTYDWFTASASKISSYQASGDEWSSAYDWYSESANKISTFIDSGTEYTQAYNWVNTSGSRYENILQSGNEYSAAHGWYSESAQKLSTISGSLSDRINAIAGLDGATVSSNFFTVGSGNTLWSWYAESAQKISTISGSLSDRINAIAGLNGATVSSNFFTVGSGNTIWDWYIESGVKIYDISTSAISKYIHSGVTLNAISAQNIGVANAINHIGDPNTRIVFTSDDILFECDGKDMLKLTDDAQPFIHFNPLQNDYDFCVHGYNQNNVLYVNAGTDRVGILDNTPSYTLEVNGSIGATSGISGTRLKSSGYISAQTGLFTHFISANNTNLTVSASPAGSDHYIQFNNAGTTGGDSNLTWNDGTTTLHMSGTLQISGGAIVPYKNDTVNLGSQTAWLENLYLSGTGLIRTLNATVAAYLPEATFIAEYIDHEGDTDSRFGFPDFNKFVIQAGGNEMLDAGASYGKLRGANLQISSTSISSTRLWVGAGYISSQTGIYTHFISANNTNLTVSASPAGSDHYVQFNNAGTTGGDYHFTFDNTAGSEQVNISGTLFLRGRHIYTPPRFYIVSGTSSPIKMIDFMQDDGVTDTWNIYIGSGAGKGPIDGPGGVGNMLFIGEQAGVNHEICNAAFIGIGYRAGARASGNDNIAIGYEAMENSSGTDNVAIGTAALKTGETRTVSWITENVAIGNYALEDVTAAYDNVAIGYAAMTDLTTGIENVAIGYGAGEYMKTQSDSVVIGMEAGAYNKKDNAIIIGQEAGYKNSGLNSTLIGFQAGYNNSGNYVVGIGDEALEKNGGNFVVALGRRAGYNNDDDCRLFIGSGTTNFPLIHGEFDTHRLMLGNHSEFNITLDAKSGNILVGDSTNWGGYNLQVSGDTILSGNVDFIGELSGLAHPTYDSGAASKNYVDSESPLTFNVANVRLMSGQNLNITRFTCPDNEKCYIWKAACCNSGGASVSGLAVELLSGSTSVYKTSSAIVQSGNPLATSNGGLTEIRIMYSGSHEYGLQEDQLQYGTAFMQISVY